jgi:DNA (cytosine-5)-methyltransferase 1
MALSAATLFSGIGAPEVAMPAWDWRWHAEIEPFPAAVMAARHPQSVNLGDVTADDFAARAAALGPVDVVVFGSPCQSYSVAGKRLGLDDPRGNLALIALGILSRLRPRWFVFENVPGLLSSWSGASPVGDVDDWEESSDFDAFRGHVDDIGYSGAWAVLDAQWFGVAQRRARVFFVGHLGPDWRRPAAVLLEPDGLCGDSPARGRAREDVACTIRAGAENGGCGPTVGDAAAGQLIAYGGGRQSGSRDTAASLNAHGVRLDFDSETLIAHTLRGEGFDASEDGTGRGVPLVVDPNQITSRANTVSRGGNNAGAIDNHVIAASGVRRLMPIECERLQGFSDDYTAITYRGKPAKDGPRYRAIGNSMAVPVIRWILERIEWLDTHVPARSEVA